MSKCACTGCDCPNKGIASLAGYCHECDEGAHRGRIVLRSKRVFESAVLNARPVVVEDRRCGDHPDYSMYLTNEEGDRFFYHCVFCSCKYPA